MVQFHAPNAVQLIQPQGQLVVQRSKEVDGILCGARQSVFKFLQVLVRPAHSICNLTQPLAGSEQLKHCLVIAHDDHFQEHFDRLAPADVTKTSLVTIGIQAKASGALNLPVSPDDPSDAPSHPWLQWLWQASSQLL